MLSIKTTLYWGLGSTENQHLLRYDINAESEGSWLVSGSKRGEYIAKVRMVERKCGIDVMMDAAPLSPLRMIRSSNGT